MAQKMFEPVSIFKKANLLGRRDQQSPQTERQRRLFHTDVVPTEPEEF